MERSKEAEHTELARSEAMTVPTDITYIVTDLDVYGVDQSLQDTESQELM